MGESKSPALPLGDGASCKILYHILCFSTRGRLHFSAFVAEQKDTQIYTVGLDAMGGTSSVVAVTTNLNGKLSALPAQPTLDGYTFDGWYTETVGGTKVTTSTVFTGDTTVYAHWTVKSTAASSSTSTSKPAQPEQTEQDDGMTLSILTVAGALLTTLAVAAFM